MVPNIFVGRGWYYSQYHRGCPSRLRYCSYYPEGENVITPKSAGDVPRHVILFSRAKGREENIILRTAGGVQPTAILWGTPCENKKDWNLMRLQYHLGSSAFPHSLSSSLFCPVGVGEQLSAAGSHPGLQRTWWIHSFLLLATPGMALCRGY